MDPSAITPGKPPRRFRFGLRTLFVLVTLASVATAWVTYSLNWIRERQAMKRDEAWPVDIDFGVPEVSAPAGLWLFGEKGVHCVYLDEATDDKMVKQIRRLFPESHVEKLQPQPDSIIFFD